MAEHYDYRCNKTDKPPLMVELEIFDTESDKVFQTKAYDLSTREHRQNAWKTTYWAMQESSRRYGKGKGGLEVTFRFLEDE